MDKVRPQMQHEAAGWEPGRLAVHVGELFRELVLAPAVAHNPFLPKRGVVDAGEGHSLGMAVSPRGRSSRSRARRATSLLDCAPATPTRVEPTVAVSPASRSGKRKAAADAEVDLQGLTPNSLLREAQRLQRSLRGLADAQTCSVPAGGRGRQADVQSTPAPLPPFPPLTPCATIADDAASVQPGVAAAAAQGEARAGLSGAVGLDGGAAQTGAGSTLGAENERHAGRLTPFYPVGASCMDVMEWPAQLARAGLPSAPQHFLNASGAAAVGVKPDVGSILEAEFMVEHIASMAEELADAGVAPPTLAAGAPHPADWRGAARNARSLLSSFTTAFRERRSQSGGSQRAASEDEARGDEQRREKPPVDSFQLVETASRAVDRQLAVDADLLQELSSLQTLRREHVRQSVFKDMASSTWQQREDQLDGELRHCVGMYGQGAGSYLVSNGMSVGKVRGAGVPTALAGVRAHLSRRATAWMESVFGPERASDPTYSSDAQRVAASALCGVVAGDCAEAAEAAIVKLLGGSRPNASAEVRREGGSVSEGTLGSLTGEAAHYSVRTAYQMWSQGLARVLGRVLVAVGGQAAGAESASGVEDSVLGAMRDFDVQANLIKIPHTLSNAGLRSACRYLPRQLSFGMTAYRSTPGAVLPDIRAIAGELGGPVLSKRLQDHEYELKASEHLSKMQRGFEDRMRALEARAIRRQGSGDGGGRLPSATAPSGTGTLGGKQSWSARRPRALPGDSRASSRTTLARATSTSAEASGSTPADDVAPRDDDRKLISDRITAVKELQRLVRARLGLSPDKDHGILEPCSWAHVGGCIKDACQPCAGGLKMPDDILQVVKARCQAKVFRVRNPAKKPG